MHKGFTLIELLIVVAIIAILAAIAVPNFLEAQMRSKISRIKNDLRTIVTGVECYRTDNNSYPIPFIAGRGMDTMFELTTPIAYLGGLPKDPFNKAKGFGNPNGVISPVNPPVYDSNYKYCNFKYINVTSAWGQSRSWLAQAGLDQSLSQDCFLIFSWGPDELQNVMEGYVSGAWTFNPSAIYDPTNGTVSWGDIGRLSGSTNTEFGRLLGSGQR